MPPSFDKDLLLITAASGKQASALIPHLTKTWTRLRLQCISAQSEARLRSQYPKAEVVRSGFSDLTSAKELLEGVSYCVLILPGFHPRETQHGINMIDAATAQKRAGGPFAGMIFSSVLHSCLRAMANHDAKRYVEEALVESQLPYVTLQPTHLMETVPMKMLVESQKDSDEVVFNARFNPETKFSFLSCRDLGEAVANILVMPQEHLYATYQLVGTQDPISYVEAMKVASEVIKKPVRVERMSLEDAVQGFSKSLPEGLPEGDTHAMRLNMTRMLAHYESHGLIGSPKILTMLLGKKPLGYREWAEIVLLG